MNGALPKPIPLDEAQRRLLDLAQPLGEVEILPIDQAGGRYLADNCIARRTQPPADLSAMDGYAIRANDGTGPWKIIGESAAGHPFAGNVCKGQAVRVSTGSAIPAGADAVLIQENAARQGDRLTSTGSMPERGKHIRRKGFDFASGDTVLPKGTKLGAAQLALAFAAGHGSLPVLSQPKVAILDSGDELVADPSDCGGQQIPASNGLMLEAMISGQCHSIKRLGPVKDDPEALAVALAKADDVDLLVTSGGASVGDHDLIRPALETWGADIQFWRVKMKPGKPIMVARRGRQLIIGLPGNPVSAYVGAFLFVLPMLRHMSGASQPTPGLVDARLDGKLPATGQRLELVRGVWTGSTVSPLGVQDSSGLNALTRANALIRREPHSDGVWDGADVQMYPL